MSGLLDDGDHEDRERRWLLAEPAKDAPDGALRPYECYSTFVRDFRTLTGWEHRAVDDATFRGRIQKTELSFCAAVAQFLREGFHRFTADGTSYPRTSETLRLAYEGPDPDLFRRLYAYFAPSDVRKFLSLLLTCTKRAEHMGLDRTAARTVKEFAQDERERWDRSLRLTQKPNGNGTPRGPSWDILFRPPEIPSLLPEQEWTVAVHGHYRNCMRGVDVRLGDNVQITAELPEVLVATVCGPEKACAELAAFIDSARLGKMLQREFIPADSGASR